MSSSCTFIAKHTAQIQYIKFYGLFKKQKLNNDIPKMEQYEICIQKTRVLVQRILCRHGWQKYLGDKRIHRETAKS